MAKGIAKFAREVRQESQKVTWPTRKETVTTTIVVVIMVAVLAVFLLVADSIIASAINFVLNVGK